MKQPETKKATRPRLLLAGVLAALVLTWIPARSQTYEELFARGVSAAQHDSLSEAESLFKQALKLSPGDYRNALVFCNLGRVQEQIYWLDTSNSSRADDAVESYSLALAIAPESVPLLQARANFCLRTGRLSRAILDFGAIITADPNNDEALTGRAYAYKQRREYDLAKADYMRVLDRTPNHYAAALGLAILLQDMHQLRDAIERLSLLILQNDAQAELYVVRADMYVENRQPELALLDLDRAIALSPDTDSYYLARARLHQQMGNKRLARRDLQKIKKQ